MLLAQIFPSLINIGSVLFFSETNLSEKRGRSAHNNKRLTYQKIISNSYLQYLPRDRQGTY